MPGCSSLARPIAAVTRIQRRGGEERDRCREQDAPAQVAAVAGAAMAAAAEKPQSPRATATAGCSLWRPVNSAAARMESHRSDGPPRGPGAQAEIQRRQGIDGGKSVVADAAGLQQKVVAGRQQPHPVPRDPRAHAQAREHAEDQSGQQQERDEIDQEQAAVGFGEEQQRARSAIQSRRPGRSSGNSACESSASRRPPANAAPARRDRSARCNCPADKSRLQEKSRPPARRNKAAADAGTGEKVSLGTSNIQHSTSDAQRFRFGRLRWMFGIEC